MPHNKSGKRTKGDERPRGSKDKRPQILIVCEGEETEPNYFEGLKSFHKIEQVKIKVVGTGRNTLSLVKHAESLQGIGTDRYAEIWCVFDADTGPSGPPPDNFDNAIHKCSGTGGKPHSFLRSAWSNESFELWFLLHLQDLKTSPVRGGHGRARDYYMEKLDPLLEPLGVPKYSKNAPNMYKLLGTTRRDLATIRATALLRSCDAATPFHERKPATTVHILVNRLLKYASKGNL